VIVLLYLLYYYKSLNGNYVSLYLASGSCFSIGISLVIFFGVCYSGGMRKIGVFIVLGLVVVLSGCGTGNQWAGLAGACLQGYSQGVSDSLKQQPVYYSQPVYNQPQQVYVSPPAYTPPKVYNVTPNPVWSNQQPGDTGWTIREGY
jgi:hypothetical protein